MTLITLDMANDHLRLDLETDGASPPAFIDPRAANVLMKVSQADAIVLNYLKIDEPHDPADSPQIWTDTDVLNVQAAMLMVLSALFDDAQGRTVEDYLKPSGPVALLLARLRDPTYA
jgi:hypothetical protein